MTAMRFGVVGTAFWAREVHLPGLLATPGAQVVGLWGRTPATVQAIAAEHGVTAFDSFDSMLGQVDALAIAVPPEVQAGLALRAAQAGKHLILEKPVARDAAAADAIAAAVRASGVASQVFFLRRFQPEVAAAVAAASAQRWDSAEIRIHSGVMVSESPYAGSVWRQQVGAALWDIGPHVLSILIPLLGAVEGIEAWPEAGGASRFRTTHAGGGTADVSVSLRSPPGQGSNWYRFRAAGRDLLLPDSAIDRRAVFSRAAGRLIDMARAGRVDDPLDAAFGARIVGILEAADRSAREGRRRAVAAL